MLNLNELNAIVSDIRNMEDEIGNKSIEPIIDSCIARHNECVDILLEVKKFLEASFPQLVSTTGNKWRKVDTYYGPSVMVNPYNCIRCYRYGRSVMVYWVDETIGFFMDENGKVSHIGIMDKIIEGVKYNQYFQLKTAGLPSIDFKKWNRESEEVVEVTKNNIEKFRRKVDETYDTTKKVIELLPVFLKKISESVMERRNTMNRLLDEAKGAGKTKTIKIEIVED